MALFLSLIGASVLVLANGVFVAAEFAIVRVRRTRLEELAGEGTVAARHAVLVVDQVSEYLALTQIGMTVSSLGLGWIGEDSFAHLFSVLLPATLRSSVILHGSAIIAAFLTITTIHVVLGELVPKNLALRRTEHLLLFLARPLQILHVVFRPALRFFESLSAWILRFLGHGQTHEQPLTEDELKLVLMDSHEEGVLTAGEAKIIIRAFEFADKAASEIMIEAARVDFISLSCAFDHNLDIARRHMHARLPLCRDGLDSVIGIVSMKDVWPLLLLDASNAAFERAVRPAIEIPPDLPQDGILKRLQEHRGQMGIVRDPADQRTLGIVTLEDVLESLLGDVRRRRRAPAKSGLPKGPPLAWGYVSDA